MVLFVIEYGRRQALPETKENPHAKRRSQEFVPEALRNPQLLGTGLVSAQGVSPPKACTTGLGVHEG